MKCMGHLILLAKGFSIRGDLRIGGIYCLFFCINKNEMVFVCDEMASERVIRFLVMFLKCSDMFVHKKLRILNGKVGTTGAIGNYIL